MYRPSTVERHNQTLRIFQEIFNKTEPKDIIMCVWAEISKESDGEIMYGKKRIIFDWECRDDWNDTEDRCEFLYPTLAQFERKFKKGNIELTIQCGKNNKLFVVAWHVDFGPPMLIQRRTNFTWKERGYMRQTNKFKVYRYSEISIFKKALLHAFKKNMRDCRCFMEAK